MSFAYTIIMPAYKEEAAVGDVIRALFAALPGHGSEYELLVIDDGSPDRTGELAREAGARVITHPYNCGYGASLKTGIRAARGKTVVFIDADGQHNPQDIPRLMAGREQFSMVVGSRGATAGSPGWRKPGKLVLAAIVNMLIGRKIPDFNSGLRALDRDLALRILPLMPNGFSFSTTSTIACFRGGFPVGYVPIKVAQRVGKSTVTVKDGFRTLMLIVRLVTVFSPLRIFLPASGLSALIGLYYLVLSYGTTGQASLKAMLMLLASVHFFLFGVLVDQVCAVRRGETVAPQQPKAEELS